MGAVLILVLLAVVFGVLGLVVKALKWLLILAALFLIAGVVRGYLARRA